MILLNNYNIDYNIISLIINYSENQTPKQWQINLSMECLQEILNNENLIIKIYNFNKEILSNIFNTLSSIYERNKNTYVYSYDKIKQKKSNKKQIEKNIIFLEGDEVSILKKNELNILNIFINIKECIQNSINSFCSLINKYKISLNKINNELSKEQELIKEIIVLPSNIFKQILLDLINQEFYNKEFLESDIQKTINYIQNIIIVYSCLNIIKITDEYLNKICQLCLEFDNEKNITVCSSILNLSKFTHIFDKKNFVLIFQTIEKIYIKYNNESKENFDLIVENIFKSYQKFFSENDTITKDIEYRDEKKEKENLLISTINNMFIDSKSINISCLKNILEALSECLSLEIKENDKENKNKELNDIIIFYLTKLLTLALLNIENIYYIYDDYIIPIINLLKQKKILINFTINLISSIIKEILFNYEKITSKIKSEINENKNNNWLLNPRWQKKLFESLLSFTTENQLIEFSKTRILICIKAIIQQSGNYIDLFGWECIFRLFKILINDNIEEIFLIIKLILNDYNAYLTIFNVMPIITLLGIFITYQKDKNICFNSIELFWSCANIVEKFHQGKIVINDLQKKIFEELLKEEKSESFAIFYSGLYYKIFSQLLRINSDFRYDIRKNGINIFTEIFVSKISTIEYENSFKIINDIFFNIFITNSKKYIDKEKIFSTKNKEENNQKNIIQKKDKELEQTLHASLLSMIKIFKSFTSDIEIKSEINSLENIYTSFLKKIVDIIPFGTISLNSDILHGLSELKNIKSNNKYLLPSKLNIFFEMMDKFNEFIHSGRFILTPYNKMICLKMINNLITLLNDIFGNKLNYDIFLIQKEQIFNKIKDIIEFVFYANSIIEKKALDFSPQRLTEIEENIFDFIQNIPIINEKYIFDYILKYINYDISIIECLIYIINKNSDNCFILKENNKNFLFQIIDNFHELFKAMKNDNIKQFIIDSKKSNKKIEIMFNDYMKLISKFFLLLVNNIEVINDEIIIKLLDFDQIIFEQIILELKSINDISFIKEISEIYDNTLLILICSLFLELLPIFYACFYESEINQKNIENRLIKIIYIGNNQINDNSKDNINIIINDSVNKTFTTILFSICKYQSKQEILDIINKSKLKNIKEKEFINKYINLKIKFTSLLITKLKENLKIYKTEYEKKKDEIIFLLNEIKNLEVFPELIENINSNGLETENETENKKNKKIHILYLYQTIIELLPIENKEIQNLIKDIMLQILDSIQIMIPLLSKIFPDEKQQYY